MANLSIRTIRYYDQIGLLKPSKIADNGYRLYTDKDFIKLQKILSLKSLGFSLNDIFAQIINDNTLSLQESLDLQKQMIDKKIENLQNIKQSLEKTKEYISDNENIDRKEVWDRINFDSMEKELVEQYKNANNINVRIHLHEKYSQNPIQWFVWLFAQYDLKPGMKILEIGCGNGKLWTLNQNHLDDLEIILSDVSLGMLNDAFRNLSHISNITYQCFDAQQIPFSDETFDIVIANHVLFYVADLSLALKEIKRVLKPNGKLYASTYGNNHMKEITELVKEYDPKITLSNVSLYDIFGLENGYDILQTYFNQIDMKHHDDYLLVDNANDIIQYILSCHGNQSEYILKGYPRFEKYVLRKMKKPIYITKDAGVFICEK